MNERMATEGVVRLLELVVLENRTALVRFTGGSEAGPRTARPPTG